ncbi:cytochrome c551 [Bacillus sp. Hm123]|uniref:cytochrome c551 n=1 Tax=Bacillus sp. Hm123 TaxID=3450745 RepID=UPI003F41C2CC
MKKSLLALLLGSSVALAACGGGEEAEPEKETGGDTAAVDGEQVYKQSCLSCHGQNLEGGAGPALDKIGSKLSEEDILNVIKNGQGGMPPNITEGADAEAVASWLASQK